MRILLAVFTCLQLQYVLCHSSWNPTMVEVQENTQPTDSCEKNLCSFTEGCPLARNTLLTTLPQMNKEFFISFEFRASAWQSGWQNVIHFTSTGGNCCSVGDRVPALWVSNSGRLHPCFAVGDNGNYNTLTNKQYSLNTWHFVEISQTLKNGKYMYRVVVDGEEVIAPVENTNPRTFSNVKVFVADNWYKAVQGSIRNLLVNTDSSNRCGGFSDLVGKGACRGLGWKSGKFPKGIGYTSQLECEATCRSSPQCTAYDIARQREDKKWDCHHFGHNDIIANKNIAGICYKIIMTPQCGIENFGKRISGGSVTHPNQYPWMVRLYFPNTNEAFVCGGALITDRHVLTAKHCVDDDTIIRGKSRVKYSVHDQTDPGDYQQVSIKDFVWPDGENHDIAIIILATPVNLNDNTVGTVCLPANNHEDYRGETATAMGWGKTSVGSDQSPVLKHVQLTVTQQQEKNWLYTEVPRINGVPQDPCSGDSGGPLVHKDAGTGRWTIIGTVNGGGFNCKDGTFNGKGRWNKVTDRLDWINDIINH